MCRPCRHIDHHWLILAGVALGIIAGIFIEGNFSYKAGYKAGYKAAPRHVVKTITKTIELRPKMQQILEQKLQDDCYGRPDDDNTPKLCQTYLETYERMYGENR